MNRSPVVAFCLALLAVLFAAPALAATFTVSNTNDSGAGSFRQALLDANLAAGADTIVFAIPGAGLHTITLTSLLPVITGPVVIDGYTQAGSSANTNPMNAGINAVLQIELTGTQVSLVFQPGSDGSTVRGLVINGSSNDKIDGQSSNLTVTGNFLGTNAIGTAVGSGAFGGFGVRIEGSAANATIGGPNPADRNLIAGNSQGGIILPFPSTTGHLIQGNYIGTDVTGNVALGLGEGLALMANASVLGNLVSGNPDGGINLLDNAVLRGNLIGTARDGTSALPNGNFGGISIDGNGSTIGGSGAGEGNVIAFNVNNGIASFTNLSGNRITQNSIHSNTSIGITLLNGGTPLPNDAGDADTVPGNHGQNYPVITSVAIAAGTATISGTINSNANTPLHLEFFANAACDASGNGEGHSFIGATDVTTDGSGNASFAALAFAVPLGQGVITSTATSSAGDTSEFSVCAAAVSGATSTSLASSLNPSTLGQSVTFTATVTGASPTGTVQFKNGAANLGGPVTLNGSGIAALATSALTQGSHAITAVYGGDVNNASSTSPVLTQIVNASAVGATTTALTSSLNPSTLGQAVTFTATVTGASPTGSVQFFNGASSLGTTTLAGGTATLTTSALTQGTHAITAAYSGDASNAASTSPAVQQVVNAGGGPPPPPGTVQPIPTMSELALLLLGALVAAGGVAGMRRYRR
ncbi:MAG TPA: Ig-like domain-containing protein [Casimicrobiaceae bacterium]|nr:Ig-like domain-containing protein [Casimicrobiaceae bacterium]